MTLADFINNLDVDVYAETNENGTTTIYFNNVEQDYEITIEVPEDLHVAYENFDIDEEVELWLEAKRNGFQGVPGVVELVEEEKTIEATLQELAIKTCDFKGA